MPRFGSLAIVLSSALAASAQPAKDADRAAKWDKDVAAIEKRQSENPPAKGGIVFAGSSSIRLWDLSKSFPEWNATNSGFGGSEVRDSTLFADRLILKHEPRAIVFYAGDNDVANNRTPDQVRDDFKAFVAAVHKALPKTRIHFIAIKPSVARWKRYETIRKANSLVKEFTATDDRLGFIDIAPLMLGSDGQPRPELFVKDGLHLSAKGYEIWTETVKKAAK
ncbi:MAG TPA: GDSL-type esterase/lipase family protein [Gemmataceae bacterium]|nr:GDSL-type esterase/lipase family protein [Gemmataceae bacterium]